MGEKRYCIEGTNDDFSRDISTREEEEKKEEGEGEVRYSRMFCVGRVRFLFILSSGCVCKMKEINARVFERASVGSSISPR